MGEAQPGIKPLVAGNWKMNGLTPAIAEAVMVRDALAGSPALRGKTDVLIAPPAPLLAAMAAAAGNGPVAFAGQDCHAKVSGAHTGDISAEMLKDAGASAVIAGHSERRSDHGETDKEVRAKAAAAHRAGLQAIVCIGETAGERHAGLTLAVVARQLKGSLPDGATAANTIVAYEPVWAIGTGLTPVAADVAEVHGAIRRDLEARFGPDGAKMRILYGGSVKPENAKTLLGVANVNGALVGGASLKSSDFLAIIRTYET
jgi:triosephosphate isomerase (TIM)